MHVLNENLINCDPKNLKSSNQMKGNSVNNLIFQKLIISVRGGNFVSRHWYVLSRLSHVAHAPCTTKRANCEDLDCNFLDQHVTSSF